MISENDEMMEKLHEVINGLPENERLIILYDADFNVEDRDKILIDMGMTAKSSRWYYLQKLKQKIKNLLLSK